MYILSFIAKSESLQAVYTEHRHVYMHILYINHLLYVYKAVIPVLPHIHALFIYLFKVSLTRT